MLCPKTVLITGANRGLGLEFVRQFLKLEKPPVHLLATCRNPGSAEELRKIASTNSNVNILKLDTTDTDSFPSFREEIQAILQSDGLNLIVNNAGIIDRAKLSEVTVDSMMNVFKTNTVGPLFLAKELLPLLQKAVKQSGDLPLGCNKAAIINMTSKVGSMEDNRSGGRYPYRISKAGLNMVTKNLSVDLQQDNIVSVSLHPGYVLTDMGGPNALITPEESVQGMMNVMAGLKEDSNGTMIDYAGKVIPW